MIRKFLTIFAVNFAIWQAPLGAQEQVEQPPAFNVEEASIEALSEAMASGQATSEMITSGYLERIAKLDNAGPKLNAVIATFPDALEQARTLDAERKAKGPRGPLHGVPILLKDNIEAKGALPTTAGSLALKDNITNRDSPSVARLRAVGAVILGKTNLSEWANIRSSKSTSGWSAIGGLVKNPYALNRNACGSSSGSGAAAAASLAAATIGTETDGSVTCPAGINGVVGFKPTVGLISRSHVVPISHRQDTLGPMARSVKDVAIMLTAMAGSDPLDSATMDADSYKGNYANGLSRDALQGIRIGVVRAQNVTKPLFDNALKKLEQAGAVLVELDMSIIDNQRIGENEFKALLAELRHDMAAYLAALPERTQIVHKTLEDLIAFNNRTPEEMRYFDQNIFEMSVREKGLDDPAYKKAREMAEWLAGPAGIDRLLNENRVQAIVAQTNGPAWLSTLGEGDKFSGPSASQLPAVAGYPHLTVPMGVVDGLPVGLSFIGGKWRDYDILRYGYAFEQFAKARIPPKYKNSATQKLVNE